MSPYRTNQVAPVVSDDPKIKVLTREIFDVEVEIKYQDGGGVSTAIKMICGDHEADKVFLRYDVGSYLIRCGIEAYHLYVDEACQHNRLWVNDDLCVPWHSVIHTKIVKKVPRKVNYRYTIIKDPNYD